MSNEIDFVIENLRIELDKLCFMVDGVEYTFKLEEVSWRLANASENERGDFRISPSGYGIHWDLIDEDISIKELINR
jgi:hypothetical protein